ncbi:MAG: DUF5103 domain-containing protein [Bacteroidales bacterium]|jgi:hypothetical protein|nr:DUF5103 domain-containing protein [Bacteroidales bacterium]
MKKTLSFFVIFLSVFAIYAQNVDIQGITMENKIYQDFVLGMNVEKAGENFSLPIIDLRSGEQLVLNFDQESELPHYFKYTYIHCTYDWQPSPNLQTYQYLSGFMQGDITDFQNSFTTVRSYINHRLLFPNDDVGILLSGNYVLYVYEEMSDNSIQPILTHRFTVTENLTEIGIEVKRSSSIADRDAKQELALSLSTSNFSVNNPRQNLRLVITQNGRYDNAVTVSSPTTVSPSLLRFNKPNEIEFEGGSEFRVFNIRTLRTTMEHVSRHVFENGDMQTYLETDKQRAYMAYANERDIDGCYFIAADDGLSIPSVDDYVLNRKTKTYTKTDNTIHSPEADYTFVHFSYWCDPLPNKDIYVWGELTNWSFIPAAKMTFSEYKHRWESTLFLKTGYYNYTYIAVDKNTVLGSYMYTEGSHWETENRYVVIAYYHGDGLQYDRVIGYKQHFSGNENY